MQMRKIYPEDLTVRQIHYLLLEKRRITRHRRLDHFHRTGRVVPLVGETDSFDLPSKSSSLSRTAKRERKPRGWLDHLLLTVEILAFMGLVAVVFIGLSTLGSLNQAFAAGMRQATLVPTPLVQAIVLPDGHTAPDAAGVSRPNEAEIPEHLRPLWQSLASVPTPLPVAEQAIRVQIRAIGVDSPVVQGNGWEQLKKGVGQTIGTPNPGENGNIVLAGHNDVYGEVFRYLDRLTPGDLVILFSTRRQYTYVITGTQMVEPTEVQVMAQTPDARVTLISCHPYLIDDHRIVVSAVLQSP
jgi:sortase A